MALDGSIWFTEKAAARIGELTQAGSFKEFAIPTDAGEPSGIAAASDGSIWFTESAVDKLGELTPNGSFTEYSVPTAGSEPDRIAIGPNGDPWFTETAGNQIGTVRAGVVVEYPVPTSNSEPDGIATSDDGTIMFAEAVAPFVGTISASGAITQWPLPTINGASALATDTAGNVWLVQRNSAGIQPGVIQLAATGSYTVGETFLPEGSDPTAVAVGPDGAAWFAEAGTGQIARITYTGFGGVNDEYDTGGSPQDIVAGPGNTLWFTDPKDNAIGRIDLTVPSISAPPSVALTAGRAAHVAITTSGFPAPTLSETGALPRGVTFTDNGDGTAAISGTALAADAERRFAVTVVANSGLLPSASQSLSIAVARPKTSRKSQRGRATASRPRVKGRVVRVRVGCHGSVGQTCEITARLTARRTGRRASTRVIARRTVTVAARHNRTVRLQAGRAARRSAHTRTAVTLTVVQHDRRILRTIRRRTITFAPK